MMKTKDLVGVIQSIDKKILMGHAGQDGLHILYTGYLRGKIHRDLIDQRQLKKRSMEKIRYLIENLFLEVFQHMSVF